MPSFPKLGVGENPQDPAVEMRRRRFSRNAKLVSLEVAGRDIRGVEWIPNEAKAVWFVCSGESTADVAAPAQSRDEGACRVDSLTPCLLAIPRPPIDL
jgi:hypothetical protein